MVIVGDIASSDQSIESGDGNDGADVKSLLNGERRRRRRRDAPAVTKAEEKEIIEEEPQYPDAQGVSSSTCSSNTVYCHQIRIMKTLDIQFSGKTNCHFMYN